MFLKREPQFPPDFVHSDFPEPIPQVRGMTVQYWDGGYATELLRKYFPNVMFKLFGDVDFEV